MTDLRKPKPVKKKIKPKKVRAKSETLTELEKRLQKRMKDAIHGRGE
jgi:hypothetical protein